MHVNNRSARAVLVPGGTLRMGSTEFYPEERPIHKVEVPSLWVDEHPVTNAEFRRFVKDTAYLTIAEQVILPSQFPEADVTDLVPGSLIFVPSTGPIPLDDWKQWWRWQPGASWRHPRGPGSTLHGLDLHPVVHVGHEDAEAYAAWAGRRLATEAEWEFAARGGLIDATYAWGDEFTPNGKVMANTWQGSFPYENEHLSRSALTSPVGSYPPNAYGLYDVTGNVWEWTASPWTASHSQGGTDDEGSCCGPVSHASEESRFVIKGGSHLCAPSYCQRYRPAARQGQTVRSSTGHLGFRCVVDV